MSSKVWEVHKPDIFHIDKNGRVEFIEVKTGYADLTINQSSVFKKIGSDVNGNSKYVIPPEAIPSGELRTILGIKKGQTLLEAGYPNGIPVNIVRIDGIEK